MDGSTQAEFTLPRCAEVAAYLSQSVVSVLPGA
jgi:hypothetical protein